MEKKTKKDFSLVLHSIVLLSDQLNISNVFSGFLMSQCVVSREWEVAEDKVSISPFTARIPFKNGVTFHIEPNKVQVADHRTIEPEESEISEIIIKFAHTLEHVEYKSVGINFHCVFEKQSPEEFLKSRFLQSGDWDKNTSSEAVGFRFIYDTNGANLNISLDVGAAQRSDDPPGEKRSIILIRANFHRDCNESPNKQQVEDHINNVPNDWKKLQSLIPKLLN